MFKADALDKFVADVKACCDALDSGTIDHQSIPGALDWELRSIKSHIESIASKIAEEKVAHPKSAFKSPEIKAMIEAYNMPLSDEEVALLKYAKEFRASWQVLKMW